MTTPALPLSPEVRAAYQDLYNQMQTELDGTMDPVAVEALNASQPQVEAVLNQDDEYRLGQNTAAFAALQKQISETNDGLKQLKEQIAATASHFAMAAGILGAISKVMTLVSGA